MNKNFEKQLLGFDSKMSNLINEWDEAHENLSEEKIADYEDQWMKRNEEGFDEIKKAFFSHSAFQNVFRGYDVSCCVLSMAVDEGNYEEPSYVDIYKWYEKFSDIATKVLHFPENEKPCAIPEKEMSETSMSKFLSRLENGDKFDAVLQDFFLFAWEGSNLKKLPYGEKIHQVLVDWIPSHVYDKADLLEYASWYVTLQGFVINILRIAQKVK